MKRRSGAAARASGHRQASSGSRQASQPVERTERCALARLATVAARHTSRPRDTASAAFPGYGGADAAGVAVRARRALTRTPELHGLPVGALRARESRWAADTAKGARRARCRRDRACRAEEAARAQAGAAGASLRCGLQAVSVKPRGTLEGKVVVRGANPKCGRPQALVPLDVARLHV